MSQPKRARTIGATILVALLALAGCGGADSTQPEANVGVDDVVVESTTGGDNETVSDTTTNADEAQTTGVATTESASSDNQTPHFDSDDLDVDQGNVVAITLDGSSATADSEAVTIAGSIVTVTAGGTYSLSGTLSDGAIIVDAPDSESVTLVLDGVDITNSSGAAIAVMNADEGVVSLAAGSTNLIADGANYVFPNAETDEPNAALYSAADLAIAGEGELFVSGNYNDGIASKDGLVISSGSISVDAVDDGIRGKDYVVIEGGAVAIASGGDGIKADNDEDEDRGYVLISDGVLDITAGDDGIQAATDILVVDGALTIDAGSASGSGRALQGDVMVLVSGGTVDANAVDDAIHSNNEVVIDGGVLTIAAGDDGVHGDLAVTINGGETTITESFEGIEAEVITINDGFIDITSNDDGLNVASADAVATAAAEVPVAGEPPVGGGGGRGGGGGGPGGGGDEAVGDYFIYINGGTTLIEITDELNEQGDGIDANGHVEMTGGVVVVSGATDTRNSALDYSGGSFVMTGGTIIGTNIDGRNSQGVGPGSTQASLYVTLGSAVGAETVAHIENAAGESLLTFVPANDYSVIVFSSPDLVAGESYDIYLGGSVTGTSETNLFDSSAYTAGDLAVTATAA